MSAALIGAFIPLLAVAAFFVVAVLLADHVLPGRDEDGDD